MHRQGGDVQIPVRVGKNITAAIGISSWCGVACSRPAAQENQPYAARHAEQLPHRKHHARACRISERLIGALQVGWLLSGDGIAILGYLCVGADVLPYNGI